MKQIKGRTVTERNCGWKIIRDGCERGGRRTYKRKDERKWTDFIKVCNLIDDNLKNTSLFKGVFAFFSREIY